MAVLTTDVLLGTTRNKINVYDRADSHFHTEGELTLSILKEALGMINFFSDFHKFEVSFSHTIGKTTCVAVGPEDHVVMVYRKGRKGPTPMVIGRAPEPCKTVTLILRMEKQLQNHSTLITAFIGSGSTPEPWDKSLSKRPDLKAEAELFWSTHALIYDEELIDWERTEKF